MAKKRRAKKKRRASPLVVARKIARKLRARGIKGSFDVEHFHVDETNWSATSADFFWLKSVQPNWIEFRARFRMRSVQDVADLHEIAKEFLRPLIDAGYTGRSIAMARTVIGEDEDINEWRSLTFTASARATLGQVGDATDRWMNKPEYMGITGFAIRIELL